MFVEQLALFHLDSLTKVDLSLHDIKFRTNGVLKTTRRTMPFDTSFVKNLEPEVFIRAPFSNLIIVEDTTIKHFAVSKTMTGNKRNKPLDIHPFLKIGQEYFVLFTISDTKQGQAILLVMDLQGNLKRREIGYFTK
jgi:hypothetical protein